VDIWYFLPFWYFWTKKNLATLPRTIVSPQATALKKSDGAIFLMSSWPSLENPTFKDFPHFL
jgi:hypothetical protein